VTKQKVTFEDGPDQLRTGYVVDRRFMRRPALEYPPLPSSSHSRFTPLWYQRKSADMISQNADRRVLASQRQVMQYLRAGDRSIVGKLPIAAMAGALNRLAEYGWIERRGAGKRSEVKLTPAGLAALQAPI
jgi:hypothetical protein